MWYTRREKISYGMHRMRDEENQKKVKTHH